MQRLLHTHPRKILLASVNVLVVARQAVVDDAGLVARLRLVIALPHHNLELRGHDPVLTVAGRQAGRQEFKSCGGCCRGLDQPGCGGGSAGQQPAP